MSTTTTSMSSTPQPSSDGMYDKLKITAQVILPAIGALYFALAEIWGFPAADKVNGTIAAVNLFVGAIVVWMKATHSSAPSVYDGTLAWEDHEEGTRLRLKQIDVDALDHKEAIRLRIERPDRVAE